MPEQGEMRGVSWSFLVFSEHSDRYRVRRIRGPCPLFLLTP